MSSQAPADGTIDEETPSPPSKKLKPADDNDASSFHVNTDSEDFPPELRQVDFTQRITWGKYAPYTAEPLPLVAQDTPPTFDPTSPALCHHVNGISGRARACTIHLKPQPGQVATTPVPTPIFMPVGTKGCLKGLEVSELTSDPALACPIILGNTYHLTIQPGSELVRDMDGLHAFQGLPKLNSNKYSYNLLTDSGGFQMVSLVKLSKITEEGVSFENPFKQKHAQKSSFKSQTSANESTSATDTTTDMLLLRPEDSIRHQNNISANIIMALDDVVSSVADDDDRFRQATYRTLRWYDRCHEAHAKKDTQNLFPIVQGALDTNVGGLREVCLAGFRHRQETLKYHVPGYAVGGLAGGESKDAFWRVVDQCCRALPDNKPRYLMGVGYPLDLLVCTALGVDMYDCVYPTRTARFGVALVPGKAPGTLRIKGRESLLDKTVIQAGCGCQPCREGITKARLHGLLKTNNPIAVELITQHNIAYMMNLVRTMRQAILENRFPNYARDFVKDQYPGKDKGGDECPQWVIDALHAAGISLSQNE